MSIRQITKEQLRRMGDREGLVLQGCGGDLQEWVESINQILTEEGILKKGAKFEEAYTFRHDGLTCLLFPFKENMELDMGKLAVWRLATHSTFGGTWLSDYVPNRLGGFVQVQESKAEPEQIKPDCPLIETNGNIFHLMGKASETLRKNGMQEQAEEMRNRIFQCQSYDSALSIIGDYSLGNPPSKSLRRRGAHQRCADTAACQSWHTTSVSMDFRSFLPLLSRLFTVPGWLRRVAEISSMEYSS